MICIYDGDIQPSKRLTLARAVKSVRYSLQASGTDENRRIAYLEGRLRLYEGTQNDSDGVARLFNIDVFGNRRTTSKPDDDMDQALRGINQLGLWPRLPEFYGGSSSNAIMNSVQSSDQDQATTETEDANSPENRARLWLGGPSDLSFGKTSGTSLPPRAAAEAYVNCYFQTGHRIFPILNRKLFVNTFNDYYSGLPTEGKGYELWSAVMYMTIALGHQYSLIDADQGLRERALASPKDGDACSGLAKASLADVPFSGGDISAVNTLLLMVSCTLLSKHSTDFTSSFSGSTTSKDFTRLTMFLGWQQTLGIVSVYTEIFALIQITQHTLLVGVLRSGKRLPCLIYRPPLTFKVSIYLFKVLTLFYMALLLFS